MGQDHLSDDPRRRETQEVLKKAKLTEHVAPRIPNPANPQSRLEHRPAPKTSSTASTSPSRETAQPQTLAR